jgi:hypothetical protein
VAIQQPWSVHRLSAITAIPDTTLRRIINELAATEVDVTTWELEQAATAVTAYRDGHHLEAITLLTERVYPATSWLVSTATTGHIYPTMLQAAAHLEENPTATYHLTPLSRTGTPNE